MESVVKKIIVLLAGFLTLHAAHKVRVAPTAAAAAAPVKPRIDRWSISLAELQQSLKEPAERASTLLQQTVAKIVNNADLLCAHEARLLPFDLQELIARAWYKKNYKKLLKIAFEQTPKLTLKHPDRIYALAVLPHGEIATGLEYGDINIWDSATGELKRTLSASTISAIAPLPNGRLVATGDDAAYIWNMATGELEHTLRCTDCADCIKALLVLPSGDIVLGMVEGAEVWDSATGQLKFILDGRMNYSSNIAMLPNGDIVTASDRNDLVIWDAQTGQRKKTLLDAEFADIFEIAILPNGDIVTASSDQTVKIWDSATGKLKKTIIIAGIELPMMAPRFSLTILSNGDILTGSHKSNRALFYGGTANIWDSATGQLKLILVGGGESLGGPVVELLNGDIAIGSSGQVTIWDRETGLLKQTLAGADKEFIGWLALLPDGSIVAAPQSRGSLRQSSATIWKANIETLFPDNEKITLLDICEQAKRLQE